MLNIKKGICEYQLLNSFGQIRRGNQKSRSTDYEAEALTTKTGACLVVRPFASYSVDLGSIPTSSLTKTLKS